MRSRHALAIVAAAALISTVWVPAADAGGAVGLRIGGGNFEISVGFGDWGLYSNHWYDPGWSLDFDVVLGGYGEWIWVDGLGRCWRPWVNASWQPFRHGRWLHTSRGWTWVAYEPWGYVPHHYGSWARCDFGWVWVPGFSYAAANGVWVRAGSYIGWYARPPHGWSHAMHGFSHGYRHGVRDGYVSGYGDGYHDGWRDARYGTWVDWRHFGADNVSQHSVAQAVVSRHRVQERALAPSAQEVSRLGGGQHRPGRRARRRDRPPDRGRVQHRTPRARHRQNGPVRSGDRQPAATGPPAVAAFDDGAALAAGRRQGEEWRAECPPRAGRAVPKQRWELRAADSCEDRQIPLETRHAARGARGGTAERQLQRFPRGAPQGPQPSVRGPKRLGQALGCARTSTRGGPAGGAASPSGSRPATGRWPQGGHIPVPSIRRPRRRRPRGRTARATAAGEETALKTITGAGRPQRGRSGPPPSSPATAPPVLAFSRESHPWTRQR